MLKSEWRFSDFNSQLSYRYSSFPNEKIKPKESQLVNLLRSIITNSYLFTQNLSKNFIMLKKFQIREVSLRERQRNSLKSFASMLNLFKSYLNFNQLLLVNIIDRFIIKTLQISYGYLDHQLENSAFYLPVNQIYLSNHDSNSNPASKNLFVLLVKFLKDHFQLSQNLANKSDAKKWTECRQLILNNNQIHFQGDSSLSLLFQ